MPVKMAGSAHLKQDSPEWAAVICILEKLCWIWVQRFWAWRECGCHCVQVPSAQHKGRVGIEEVVRTISEHLPTTSALSCWSLLLDVHFKSILVLPLHSFVPLLITGSIVYKFLWDSRGHGDTGSKPAKECMPHHVCATILSYIFYKMCLFSLCQKKQMSCLPMVVCVFLQT